MPPVFNGIGERARLAEVGPTYTNGVEVDVEPWARVSKRLHVVDRGEVKRYLYLC